MSAEVSGDSPEQIHRDVENLPPVVPILRMLQNSKAPVMLLAYATQDYRGAIARWMSKNNLAMAVAYRPNIVDSRTEFISRWVDVLEQQNGADSVLVISPDVDGDLAKRLHEKNRTLLKTT